MNPKVTVIGAGLAGLEATWQLTKRGISVHLIDQKPDQLSPAHHSPLFGELVCSNSLRSEKPDTASGVLKQELRHFDSFILKTAEETRIPAGNALAVDREEFPRRLTDCISHNPLVSLTSQRVEDIAEFDFSAPVIVATGPMTDDGLYDSLCRLLGEKGLYFFDAAAPLVEEDSLDREIVFSQSRYEYGSLEQGDYLNCPFGQDEYLRFYEALTQAEKTVIHDFEKNLLFSGCQPVEALADEGIDTLRFGPMKPVGLTDPRTGKEPYAVVQLRQDNFAGTLYNLVGFQTRLLFPEQDRVFRLIPGLEQARFVRHGVMHRNTFLCSPRVLTEGYRSKTIPNLYFAGQITGVEGYLESVSSGLLAALSIACSLGVESSHNLPSLTKTVMGGLQAYVTGCDPDSFQPLKANFSVLEPLQKEEVRLYRNQFGLSGSGRPFKRSLYGLRSQLSLGELSLAKPNQNKHEEERQDHAD